MNDADKDTFFQRLFAENRDRVYRLTWLYCSTEPDRQDLFQDIFCQVWRALDSFRAEAKIETWVYRIAINTGINACRRQKSRRQRFDESKTTQLEQIAAEPSIDIEPDLQKLYACIRQLSRVDQTLIHLYLERLSAAEIAQVLAITPVNVRVRVHRIKNQIKNIWEKAYGPME